MSDFRLTPAMQQQQRLKMTPQMIQSINLLALPVTELRERIYEEAEKNPALEIVHDASFDVSSVRVKNRTGSSSDSDTYQSFLESIPGRSETLQEHLLFQLSVCHLRPDDRALGEKIIQNLDRRGYHIIAPESLLSEKQMLPQLERVLHLIQSFDPAGVACADLRESLLIQANRRPQIPRLVPVLLSGYFHLLEKPRASAVFKKLTGAASGNPGLSEILAHCTEQDAAKAIDFIRTLNPFPAREFVSPADTPYIFPDVRIRRSSSEELEETGNPFTVELVQGTVPELRLAEDFSSFKERKDQQKHTEDPLADGTKTVRDAVKNARWFISAVQQRNVTMLKICRAILEIQRPFFEHGSRFLAPLRMKDIAEKVGVHEATVSRIANGKYLQCEWGLFEIRYFFSNSVVPQNPKPRQSPLPPGGLQPGFNRSKESVKEELRQIILQEGAHLSDEKLSRLLVARGVKIARRTVAKYRAELNIDSSFGRKQDKTT